MKLMITGGAGFIGSAMIRHIIAYTEHSVINIDCLTYAGNLSSVQMASKFNRYYFEEINITDVKEIKRILDQYQPDVIMHFAAESHVDRSIDNPQNFIETNINGTYVLLEQAYLHYQRLDSVSKNKFRFHHISTDEVYGSLGEEGLFTEDTPYRPTSPYSASKASADHLVRAWYETYGLPVITTNCSNNYGPNQFPEKLIPTLILNAISGDELPIYGDGKNIRDWLYVEDHVRALLIVLANGRLGETYNIGGNAEKTNLQVVNQVCKCLDEIQPIASNSYMSQVTFVKDRPGHDRRYAIDITKIKEELKWEPQMSFENGIKETVKWYLNNQKWCQEIIDGSYKLERIGLGLKK